ncbi:ABC transporter permease [Candidatus Thorarchaeota archaeon]|nr:MAG: ABC transporter permease [Candidatus Thorarchaeota archaeon]
MPDIASKTGLEQVTGEEPVRTLMEKLDIRGKPWHVNLISLGAFLLISCLLIVGVDMAVNVLMTTITYDIAQLDFFASLTITFTARVLGMILFIMTLWIGFLGKPLYEKRPAQIVLFILKISVVFLLFMAFSIGIAAIAAFVMFLWNPRFLVNWSKQRMKLYHGSVVGILGVWLFLEIILTEDVVGADVLPSILSGSVGSLLAGTGLSWIAVFGAFIILPLYIFIPRIIMTVWDLRRGIEQFWEEFVHDRLGVVGFLIIVGIALLAVLAPVIAPEGSIYHWDYKSSSSSDWFQPPSLQHPFGTNHDGADLLGRVIWGTQVSLLVGLTASLVAVSIGTVIGLIAGYYGGLIDSVLMRITDVFLCLPSLPLMLVFLVLYGQGLQNVIIVIAILGWTGTARMVRSEALSLRERPLTEAAHAIGASDNYILFRHILPNTLPLILANVILGVVNAILSEAGISFLGFMPIHGQPSWGIILHWAQKKAALANQQYWWIVPPGMMIMLTSMAFAFVSHAADKVVNPRLRGRRA